MYEQFAAVKRLLYDAATPLVALTNEQLMIFILLSFAIVCVVVILFDHWRRTAGERKMRRARKLELDRKIADAVTDMLLSWCTKDEITVKEMAELSRRVGVRLDVHDLLPGESPKIIKKKIRRRLFKLREERNTGIIPGPKPGEEITSSPLQNITTVTETTKQPSAVGRFFTKKTAAKAA